MNPTKETLIAIIIAAVQENMPPDVPSDSISFDEKTILFGPGGLLDSLALVNVVLDVEEGVRDRWGATIALADEKAMSQSRSPFRRIGSLADYALQLIAGSQTAV